VDVEEMPIANRVLGGSTILRSLRSIVFGAPVVVVKTAIGVPVRVASVTDLDEKSVALSKYGCVEYVGSI
jgi:hypothetical protein